MREEYTISIFTEDHIGIFNQITNIFTRRQINIDSITCSITAVPGVSLITLVVKTTHNMITTVAKQIERIIDVLKVFVHTSDQIIYQEIALFKVAANGFLEGNNVDQVVRNFSARIIEISPEYVVLEKTGHQNEITELQKYLSSFGLLQVSRSGRVAITKQVKELNSYLEEMDEANRGNAERLRYNFNN